MRDRVLFICHVEPMFEHFFARDYLDELEREIHYGNYDYTILLDSNIDKPYEYLQSIVDETWEWSWGYEPEIFYDDDPDKEWLIPSHGHEWTWVPWEIRERQKDFQKSEIDIVGGADRECLADWEAVLEHMGIKYARKEHLVYPLEDIVY